MRGEELRVTSKDLHKGDINSKVEVFKQSPHFAHLSEDKLSELVALATFCYFRKGEFIFYEGETPEFFYIVQEGRVKLFKQSACGKDFTVGVLPRGDIVHSSALFDGKAYWASVQAMSDVILLRIRLEEFLSFVANNPSVAMSFISLLGEQVHTAYNRLRDMAVDRVDQRLIRILCMLSSKFGNTLFFTAEEIAELVGTTRETTSRVMGQLKNSGIIHCTRGKITILDETRLHLLSRDLDLVRIRKREFPSLQPPL